MSALRAGRMVQVMRTGRNASAVVYREDHGLDPVIAAPSCEEVD